MAPATPTCYHLRCEIAKGSHGPVFDFDTYVFTTKEFTLRTSFGTTSME